MIHTSSVYISTICVSADAKHWKNLKQICSDEPQLTAYIIFCDIWDLQELVAVLFCLGAS